MSDLMKPGRYYGRLVQQQLTKASTGTAQVALTFEVLGKIDLADPEGGLMSCDKVDRTVFRAISQKTVDWVTDDIKHLCEKKGIAYYLPGWEWLDERSKKTLDLLGAESELSLEHNTYNGSTRERWSIYRGDKPEAKPLESDEVRKLNTLFGSSLTKKTAKPVQPEEIEAAVANDDEIPF